MTRRFVQIHNLTQPERGAERAMQVEKDLGDKEKCPDCVNGFQVFELWTCDTGREWPRCMSENDGYEIKVEVTA